MKKRTKVLKGGQTVLFTVKTLSFISFTIVSIILSFYMFISFSDIWSEKILLGLLNLSLESFKVYSIIMYTTFFYFYKLEYTAIFNLKELRRKYVQHFIAYLLVASVSVIASLGFTLTVVDRYNTKKIMESNVSYIIEDKENLVKEYENQIKSYENQIQSINKIIESLPYDFVTRKQQLLSNVNDYILKKNDLSKQKTDILLEINELKIKEKAMRSGTSRSMFDIFGEILNIKTGYIMIIILGIASFLIELGAFYTAPTLVNIASHKDNKSPVPTPTPTREEIKIVPQEVKATGKYLPQQKQIETVKEEKKQKEESTPPIPKKISRLEQFIDKIYSPDHTILKSFNSIALSMGLSQEEFKGYERLLRSLRDPSGEPFFKINLQTKEVVPQIPIDYLKNYLRSKNLLD